MAAPATLSPSVATALTSPKSVMAALAIILLDLASRSGLDKMLARNGSPALVALWAQLQTVVAVRV